MVDVVVSRAIATCVAPKITPQDTPESDREIVELFLSNPAGIIQSIREMKEREVKRIEQKAQIASAAEILEKLSLD